MIQSALLSTTWQGSWCPVLDYMSWLSCLLCASGHVYNAYASATGKDQSWYMHSNVLPHILWFFPMTRVRVQSLGVESLKKACLSDVRLDSCMSQLVQSQFKSLPPPANAYTSECNLHTYYRSLWRKKMVEWSKDTFLKMEKHYPGWSREGTNLEIG